MFVILGLGKSGEAVRRFLQQRGLPYVCVDCHPQCPEVISDEEAPQLIGVTALIKSPGIRMEHPWVVAAQKRGIPIRSELDLAWPLLTHKRVVGITGSNGKTTTVMALGHVMSEEAVCVGNIGVPLLAMIEHPASIFIVELSSFQLEGMELGPWFDVGCILNVTPNHLDHHGTIERYAAAKRRLASCMKEESSLFMEKDFVLYEEKVETIFQERYRSGRQPLYPHDRANFAATYAMSRALGLSHEEFAQRIATVQKPPHRLEWVCDVDGVSVINDSKATSVDATLKAVAALPAGQHLIVGGVDKGASYHPWREAFAGKVRQVYAIGEAAEKIEQEIGEAIPLKRMKTLQEAVEQAMREARAGESVLLSPGCSSYDQFVNFEQRGEVFKQLMLSWRSRPCRREQ